MEKKDFIISSKFGLHAKIATSLVNEANKFDSEIDLSYEGIEINLKSIMGLMSLGVPSGAKISLLARGIDETLTINSLARFIINESIGQEL